MSSVATMTYQDALDSQYLTNSISGLSRSRNTNSLIVRTYKQATQLYLTKRFKEALDVLDPIVNPQQGPELSSSDHHGASNGAAPVAQSSRGTRTKVWVFYLSLLHAIVELGAEEGRNTFGSAKWRQLATKAREGTVWDEIARYGYAGNEGDLDPDVVVNLSTLLLSHMQTQRLNQQKLETYLSASADAAQMAFLQDGIMTPMSNGTSSPRELTTRLKILELYALHVLPANDEWEYAQQFIEMNDMLDEERRDAFLNALESLKEGKDGTAQRERELEELREREMEQQRFIAEARRKEEERKEEEQRLKAAANAAVESEKARTAAAPAASSSTSSTRPAKPTRTPSLSGSGSGGKPSSANQPPSKPSSSSSKPPNKKIRAPPPNLYTRASSVISNLQQMILDASRNVTFNNMALMRFLMFLIAFLLIIARRDFREKLKRAIQDSWAKVKQTVGMGVKVSYI